MRAPLHSKATVLPFAGVIGAGVTVAVSVLLEVAEGIPKPGTEATQRDPSNQCHIVTSRSLCEMYAGDTSVHTPLQYFQHNEGLCVCLVRIAE